MITILHTLTFFLLFQQPPVHSVTISWNDTANPVGTTYRVYRSPGPCQPESGLVWTRIADALPDKSYADTPIAPTLYCYAVSAVFNNQESVMSNFAPANVPDVFAPTSVLVTIQ
jgi:hypothetical protein